MEELIRVFLEGISPFLQDLIQGLVALLITFLVAYTKSQVDLLKTKLSGEQAWILETIARKAVESAEQIYNHGENQQKKDYAVYVIETALAKQGVKFDLDVILAQVESAVFGLSKPQ